VQAHPDDDLRASLYALRAFLTNRNQRDHARATALHEQALALWRAGGNRHAVASGLYNLAVVDYAADRHEAALEGLRPVLAQARADQDWRRTSQSLNVIGGALAELHRWAEAAEAYGECIGVAWRSLAPHDLAYGLWNMPHALAHLRQPERAWRMMAFASHFWRTRFGPLDAESLRELQRVRRLCAVQLGPARLATLHDEGAAMSLAQAVALALEG
jgi:tetratricopeptide (TPR) repeat protein